MGKVTKCVMNILFSILLAGIAYSIGNVVTGSIAVLFKINDANVVSYIVLAIAFVLFIVAMYLLWSGRLNTTTREGVKCLKVVVSVGLGIAISGSVLYMVLLGEIKQTMLFITVLGWVMLFVFIHILNKIDGDLVKSK